MKKDRYIVCAKKFGTCRFNLSSMTLEVRYMVRKEKKATVWQFCVLELCLFKVFSFISGCIISIKCINFSISSRLKRQFRMLKMVHIYLHLEC